MNVPAAGPVKDSTGTLTLQTLPPELLDLILSHVPANQRTRAALALASVLHHEPSKSAVFRHVVVRRGAQLVPLWRKMKDVEAAKVVRTFSLVSFSRGRLTAGNMAWRCGYTQQVG